MNVIPAGQDAGAGGTIQSHSTFSLIFFSDINSLFIIVEGSSAVLSLVLVRFACQTCLESTCSSTSEWGLSDRDLWSINNGKSRRHSGPVLTETSSHTHWCRHTHECTEERWCVSEGPHCPFSEATVTKAACFFEKSSSPLSPVPHRKNAEGDVCQRTRAGAIYSALLSSLRDTERRYRGQFTGWWNHPKVNGTGKSWRRKTIKRKVSVLIS